MPRKRPITESIKAAARRLTGRKRPAAGFLVLPGIPTRRIEIDGAAVDLPPGVVGFCLVPPGSHLIRIDPYLPQEIDVSPGGIVVRSLDPGTGELVKPADDVTQDVRNQVKTGEIFAHLAPHPSAVIRPSRLLVDLSEDNLFKSYDLLLVDLAFTVWAHSPTPAALKVYERALARNEGFGIGDRIEFYLNLATRAIRHLERRPAVADAFAVETSLTMLVKDLRATGDPRGQRAADRLGLALSAAQQIAPEASRRTTKPEKADRRLNVHLRGALFLFIWVCLAVLAPGKRTNVYFLLISPIFLIGLLEVFGVDLIARLRHFELLVKLIRRR